MWHRIFYKQISHYLFIIQPFVYAVLTLNQNSSRDKSKLFSQVATVFKIPVSEKKLVWPEIDFRRSIHSKHILYTVYKCSRSRSRLMLYWYVNNLSASLVNNCAKFPDLYPYPVSASASVSGSVSQRYGSEDPHPEQYKNVNDPLQWFAQTWSGLSMWYLLQRRSRLGHWWPGTWRTWSRRSISSSTRNISPLF